MQLEIRILLLMLWFGFCSFGQTNIDSLFREAEKTDNDSTKISILLQIADYTRNTGNISGYRNTVLYVETIIRKSKNKDVNSHYKQLIGFYKKSALYDSLIHTYRLLADYSLSIGDTVAYLDASNWQAYFYTYLGNFDKSLSLLYENLKLSETLNDSSILMQTYVMMGFVVRESDLLKARECFKKALLYSKDTLNHLYSTCLNEIGNTYTGLNEPDKAIPYLKRAMKIREAKNETTRLFSYNDIAYSYSQMGKYNDAIYYMEKCIRLEEEMNDKRSLALTCSSLGFFLYKAGDHKKAEYYLFKSLDIAEELNLAPIFVEVYHFLYLYNKETKDFKNALFFYEQQMNYEDSVQKDKIKEQITEIEKKYRNEKQEAELVLIKKVKLEKEKVIKNQRIAGGLIIFLSLSISLFAFIAYRSKQREKLANTVLKMQNEEILQQKEKIEETSEHLIRANKKIAEKNKFITDNIKYARKIQQAMLTSEEEINAIIPENFVLYKPKNIVSGDFYNVKKNADTITIIVADCTGHGVSGAFMSILGMSLINEILLEEKYNNPAEFLAILRAKVKQSLHQNDKYAETVDGMDLAICTYDTKSMNLVYSGAQISLYIAKDKAISEMKADFMPVGMGLSGDKPFNMQSVKLTGNETIYLFSDGYPDQFGGKYGKKFMLSRLLQMLTEICDKPMKTQKSYLEAAFKNWQGEHTQLDDIVFAGFKLKS
jgi:serine phosphatase RsbU (regulator of sigma subunit)